MGWGILQPPIFVTLTSLTTTNNKPSQIIISFWNLNGLNIKYSGHKLDTYELQNLLFKSDIFGLGVTMEAYSSNLSLEGYEVYNFSGFKKSKTGRCSGGFVILIKRWLIPFLKWIKSSRDDKYCKWLQIQLIGNEPLTLGFIYIPPEDANTHFFLE